MNIALEQTEQYVNGSVKKSLWRYYIYSRKKWWVYFNPLPGIERKMNPFLVFYISFVETIEILVYLLLLSERSLLTEALGVLGERQR